MRHTHLYLICLLLAAAANLLSQPGSLDPGFGKGGVVTTNILSSTDQAFDAVLRPDGRLLVVGSATYDSSSTFAAVQLLPDGTLDASFEYDGKFVFSRALGRSVARTVALYADGRAILAGTGTNNQQLEGFALLRLLPDGFPDPTFGTNGWTRTAFDAGNSSAEAVAIQPDGRIIAAGFTSPDGVQSDLAIARYWPNGTLDTSFGSGGKVAQAFGTFSAEVITSIALQPDGKIVLGGYAVADFLESDYLLLRYLPDGKPDPSFGDNGVVLFDFDAPFDVCQAIAIQPDGKIVAAGFSSIDFLSHVSAIRLLPDGTLDNTFGTQGKLTHLIGDFGSFGTALQLLPDGNMLISGMTEDINARDFFIMRLLANGTVDWNFGNLGATITSVSAGDDNAYALTAKPDGGILLVGKSDNPKQTDVAVLQYTANGSLDAAFGNGGVTLVDNGSSRDHAVLMLLLDNGNILVSGSLLPGDGSPSAEQDPVLLRYTANGVLDTSFQQTGFVVHKLTNGMDAPFAFAATPEGDYLAAGQLNLRAGIWKYKSNGTLDGSFGTNGRYISGFPSGSAYTDLVVQPDGHIIAVGRNAFAGTTARDNLQRFLANGTPDQSLQKTGIINQRYGAGYTEWMQVHLFPDNSMLLLGLFDNGFPLHDVLVRLTADGSLDASFADNGFFTITLAEPMRVQCFTVLTNGKILIGGYRGNDFAVGKLNANGTWDPTFGNNGWVSFNAANTSNKVFKMAVQSDGKIVVTGQYRESGLNKLAIMRLLPNGELDASFLPNGGLSDVIAGSGADVQIEPSGNILVLPSGVHQGIHSDIMLVRLLASPSVGTADLPGHETAFVLAYPNPVSESLQLEYKLLSEQSVDIRLYDTGGRNCGVLLHNQRRGPGLHRELLTVPPGLPAGMYLLELSTPARKTVLRIFIR